MKKILFFAFAICLAVCFVSCSSEKSSSKITEAQWKSAFDIVINRGAVDGKTLYPLSKDTSETETLRSSYGFKMVSYDGITENPVFQLVTPTWLIQHTENRESIKLDDSSNSWLPGIIVIRDENGNTYSLWTNEDNEWEYSGNETGYYMEVEENANAIFQHIQNFCINLKELYAEATIRSDGKMSVPYTDTYTDPQTGEEKEEKLNIIVGFDKNMKLNWLGFDNTYVTFEYPTVIEFSGIPRLIVAD